MTEEDGVLKITGEDIQEANQLSLNCPICAGPVEKNVGEAELAPIVCAACGTLYHRACWDRNGSKCAILGCSHTVSRPYGMEGPLLTISMQDIPSDAEVRRVERRNKQLKQIERDKQRVAPQSSAPQPSRGFWATLFGRILRAFGGGG